MILVGEGDIAERRQVRIGARRPGEVESRRRVDCAATGSSPTATTRCAPARQVAIQAVDDGSQGLREMLEDRPVILSDLSVTRPVLASVLSLLLIAFGLVAFDRLPLREYPDIDPPVVSIETVYPGAAANVVETRITQLIEDRVSGWRASRPSSP